MKKLDLVRKPLMLLIAAAISVGLVFSIPIIHFVRQGEAVQKESRHTEVKVIQQEKKEEPQRAQREIKRPERRQMQSRALKSGPRFAMDLGVAGVGGVSIPSDLVAKSSGKGETASSGDVDHRPQARQSPDFELPRAVRENEQNAYVLVTFCVDRSGAPYEFRIVEERPSGLGLGDAARSALSRVRFDPATKEGRAVPFCGMEQPFEVLFTN